MNLDGKYIEIDRNKIKETVHLLYNIGYYEIDPLNPQIRKANEVISNVERHYKEYDDILYLHTFNNIILISSMQPRENDFFDINKLLRESKLKRILNMKSKGLMK